MNVFKKYLEQVICELELWQSEIPIYSEIFPVILIMSDVQNFFKRYRMQPATGNTINSGRGSTLVGTVPCYRSVARTIPYLPEWYLCK